jgi:hypothetical protein
MPQFRALHAVIFGAVAALQLFAAYAEAQEKAPGRLPPRAKRNFRALSSL